MKTIFRTTIPILAFFLLILSGCNPTSLTQIWKSPDYTGGPMKEIVVMAVFHSEGTSNRFEEIVADELNKAGVKAELGYKLLQDKGKVDKAEMDNMVKESGADGVLVFKFKGVNKQQTYYPGSVVAFPDFYYSYYRYWWYTYDVVRTPGYVQTDKWVKVESNLYEAAPDKLVWTGRSETINPGSVESLAQSIAKEVILKLADEGFIQTNPDYKKSK